MAEQLGTAILELDANLAPLDAKLDKAKARVASSVAAMQAMIDSLHGNADIGVSGGSVSSAGRSGVGGGGAIWGVRGPEGAGSARNPIVTVLESSKYTPLGSQAAAIGEASQSDAQRNDAGSPVVDAASIQALTSTMADVASNLSPLAQLAQQGQSGFGAPATTAAQTTSGTGSSKGDEAAATLAMQSAADAMAKLHGDLTSAQKAALAAPSHSSSNTATRGALVPDPMRSGSRTAPIPVTISGGGSSGGGGGGRPVAYGAGGGDGGGGNRRVDIYHHSDGGGGGGGSRFQWTPGGGSRSNPDSGVAGALSVANLFKGDGGRGGAFGLPGFGSVGSLAGLGLEHWLLSALGVGASATSAVAGGALLGTASLSKAVVGSGSDAIVNKVTLSQVEKLIPDYQALSKAVGQFGSNSAQAAKAQQAINQALGQLGGGAQEEGTLASNVVKLENTFEQTSGAARSMSAEVMNQAVELAQDYVPFVTQAAQRNLSIVNTGLRPLFQWLEGPDGKGVFTDLENDFADTLPTSIHAFDMAVEDFLRLMQVAAGYTGGFSKTLDTLFTDKNKESTTQYQAEVQKLVDDFDRWKKLLTVLAEDLDGIFKEDSGTANSIVGALTQMLEKLHQWEQSATGQTQLQNIFAVHKQEIMALLGVLPKLIDGYGSFYLKVAPPLVKAVTGIANAFADMASAIEKIPGGADLLGFGIVASKLGILMPLLKQAATLMGVIDVEEKGGSGGIASSARIGSTGARAAESGAEDVEGAAGAGGIGALLAKGASALPGVSASPEVIAAAASSALPFLLAGGGMAVTAAAFQHFVGMPGGTATFSKGGLSGAAGAATPENEGGNGRFGNVTGPHGNPLSSQTLDIQEVGNFSKYSVEQLQHLKTALEAAGGVKVNGISETKSEVMGLANAALSAKEKLKTAFTEASGVIGAFYRDGSRDLGSLKDDFQSNMKLIESTVGTGSAKGQQLFAENVQKMVTAVTQGMLSGKVGVQQGMTAINQALAQGTQKGALTFTQSWQSMFKTVVALYQDHKIDTQTYMSDVQSIMSKGDAQIKQNSQQTYQQLVQNLQQQLQKGQITHQEFVASVAKGEQTMNATTKTDMGSFAGSIIGAFENVTQQGGKGLQDLVGSVDSALKALGAKPLSGVQVEVLTAGGAAASVGNTAASAVKGVLKGAAQGALVQIGRPGERGHDTVPMSIGGTDVMVGKGEIAAVLNHDQQALLNSRLADMGGLPGMFGKVNRPHYMAEGGFVPGYAGGGVIQSTSGPASGETFIKEMGAFLVGHGLTKIAAAGALGNMGRESTWNTGSIGTGGAGAIGWTPPTKIPGWNGSPSGPWNSLTVQENLLWNGSPAAGEGLKNFVTSMNQNSTVAGATEDFETSMENAGIVVMGDRIAFAEQAYNVLRGLPAGSIPGGDGADIPTINAPNVKGSGAFATMAGAALKQVASAANSYLSKMAPAAGPALPGMGGEPNFPVAKGPVPAVVQKAKDIASAIAARSLPYVYGGYADDWREATGLDCSGFVSTVLNAVGLVPGHEVSGYFEQWGENGPGKWITTGALGAYSGPTGHVMMEIDGEYFESGGRTSAGPHVDSGWSSPFTYFRHPAGLASGGVIGQPGHQPTLQDLMKMATVAPKTAGEKAFIKANKGKPKKPKAGKKLAVPGKAHKEKPSTITQQGTLGYGGEFPFSDKDLTAINSGLNAILGIDGGDSSGIGVGSDGTAPALMDQLSWLTGTYWPSTLDSPNFGDAADPANFVITQDANGNAIAPYISPNINTVVTELGQAIGSQNTVISQLESALNLSQAMPAPIKKAIARRTKEIAAIQKKVKANVEKIKQLRAQVKKLQADAKAKAAAIAAARATLKTYNSQLTAEQKKGKKADPRRIATLQGQINGQVSLIDRLSQAQVGDTLQAQYILTNEIPQIEAQNQQLGGSKDKLGTGGEIGQISAQLGAAASGNALSAVEGGGSSASGLYSLLSTVESWPTALNGVGGEIPQQQLQLLAWNNDLAGLVPGADSAYASAAANYASSSSTATSADDSQLLSLLQQWQQTEDPNTGLYAAVSQLQGQVLNQYQAMNNLPPYGGSFATGGVVPGPVGAAATIVAHGGETIVPVGGGVPTPAPPVHVHIDKRSDLASFIDVRIEQAGRKTARTVGRQHPSGGGGLLRPTRSR